MLAGLLDLKQILHLSRRRKHQLFLGQLHIYKDHTWSATTAWRIPLHHSSLFCAFSFVKNIEILENHLAELLCNFLLQWKASHTQNWLIFNKWNTPRVMLNSWFPERVQTGTVVTIINVHLDMLLFRRKELSCFIWCPHGAPNSRVSGYFLKEEQPVDRPHKSWFIWRTAAHRKDQCQSNEKIIRSKEQQKGEQQRGTLLGCPQTPIAHPTCSAWGEDEV